MTNTPDKIILHHTAISGPGDQLWKVENYHKSRGWAKSNHGWHIGYHYLIEKSGKVIYARHETEEAAHTIGQNKSSIGVALAGNFNFEEPTADQIKTLKGLLSRIVKTYGLRADRIFGHRSFGFTDCPGTRLGQRWGAFLFLSYELNWVKALLEKLRLMLN